MLREIAPFFDTVPTEVFPPVFVTGTVWFVAGAGAGEGAGLGEG